MAGFYVRAHDLVKRLQLELPVVLELPDPITGHNFTLNRENVCALLTIDATNVVLESQSNAALYAEMARAQRGCERASQRAELSYRKWKADIGNQYRQQRETAGEKVTDKSVEEAYRAHPDYSKMADLGAYYTNLAGLFEDLKMAFKLKSEECRSISSSLRGHEHVLHVEDELDRLEDQAARVIRGEAKPAQAAPEEPPAEDKKTEETKGGGRRAARRNTATTAA